MEIVRRRFDHHPEGNRMEVLAVYLLVDWRHLTLDGCSVYSRATAA